jgi:hypothetical protein
MLPMTPLPILYLRSDAAETSLSNLKKVNGTESKPSKSSLRCAVSPTPDSALHVILRHVSVKSSRWSMTPH